MNTQAVSIFTHQSKPAVPLMMARSSAQMRPEDVTELLHESVAIYVRLNTLEQLIASLENSYHHSLRK